MSEASAYQDLRAHLSTLRLGAAAEALPAELEQARADKSSHTAFLRSLLAVEVDATLARFACLPSPWRIADFDFDAQPSVDRSMVMELASPAFLEHATNVSHRPARGGQDHVGRGPRLGGAG
jgi:hypothetical protein